MSKLTNSNRAGRPGLISVVALAAAWAALLATPVRVAAADQRVAVLELGQPWGQAQLPVARFTPARATPISSPAAVLPAGASVGASLAGMVAVPATAQVAQMAQAQLGQPMQIADQAAERAGAQTTQQASQAPLATMAAAPAAPAPQEQSAAVQQQSWEVRTSDVTLSRTLERWAASAGYRLKWDAARNFLISAPSTFSGDFEEALSQALSTPGVRLSDYPLEACIYPNTPPLARITRQGEQTRECAAVSSSSTQQQ